VTGSSYIDRNAAIWAAYQGGAGIPAIASAFGISKTRAKQIVHTSAAREYLRLQPPPQAEAEPTPGEAT
jgi:hypothetical protein